MKNSSYKFLIIFVFILLLGVGYAVVSSVGLSISGSSSVADETLDVVFTGEYSVSNSSIGSATVVADSRSASFEVTDIKLNQSVTFYYTIKNKETDIAANVSITSTGSNDYYSITTKEIDSLASSFTLNPNYSKKVAVTVRMIKTPITEDENTAKFTVTLGAVPVETDAIEIIEFDIYDQWYYQAVEGMTWREWVDSEYNIGGLYIEGDYIRFIDSYISIHIDGEKVYCDEIINPEEDYSLVDVPHE